MAYEKLLRLAQALYEKTKSGELSWETTPNEATFQASFPKYSILLQKDGDDVNLKICNEEGRVMEELTDEEAFQHFDRPILGELFEIARRGAMGVEEALDEILSNLESSRRARR